MLSSDNEGDRLTAVNALNRILTDNGLAIHDLTALIEHDDSEYSEADVKQIYAAAFADGQKSVEQPQGHPDQIDWRKIADAIVIYIDDLSGREREFIKSVVPRIRVDRPLTP